MAKPLNSGALPGLVTVTALSGAACGQRSCAAGRAFYWRAVRHHPSGWSTPRAGIKAFDTAGSRQPDWIQSWEISWCPPQCSGPDNPNLSCGAVGQDGRALYRLCGRNEVEELYAYGVNDPVLLKTVTERRVDEAERGGSETISAWISAVNHQGRWNRLLWLEKWKSWTGMMKNRKKIYKRPALPCRAQRRLLIRKAAWQAPNKWHYSNTDCQHYKYLSVQFYNYTILHHTWYLYCWLYSNTWYHFYNYMCYCVYTFTCLLWYVYLYLWFIGFTFTCLYDNTIWQVAIIL